MGVPVNILFLLVWLAMPAACAWMAVEKSRPFLEGFLVGFLLGPLGLLVELILPTRQADVPMIDRAYYGKGRERKPFDL